MHFEARAIETFTYVSVSTRCPCCCHFFIVVLFIARLVSRKHDTSIELLLPIEMLCKYISVEVLNLHIDEVKLVFHVSALFLSKFSKTEALRFRIL